MTFQKHPFFTLKLLAVAFLFGVLCTSCGNPLNMTRAVFSLYAYDHFSLEDFEKINKKEEDFMVNGRGFHRFREFNQFVLTCCKNRAPNQTAADLYPTIIEWLKKQP